MLSLKRISIIFNVNMSCACMVYNNNLVPRPIPSFSSLKLAVTSSDPFPAFLCCTLKKGSVQHRKAGNGPGNEAIGFYVAH